MMAMIPKTLSRSRAPPPLPRDERPRLLEEEELREELWEEDRLREEEELE